MSTVNNVTNNPVVQQLMQGSGSSASSSEDGSVEGLEDRFLTLLVTQIQNQDPLNPMENAELTSQLAQMSTVQGIEQLNTQLTSLVDGLAQTQAVQASSLIGNTVLVPGSGLTLSDGEAYGGVNLASAADQVTVSILDSTGKVVQTQTLGANEAGNVLFSWDGATTSGGTAADGSYTFKVEATKSGVSVTAEALQIGTVSALTRTTGGSFQLDLGSLGMYDFSDVQQIF